MRGGLRDATDRKLVALLSEDARRSTMSLAKQLGLARTTVHERIERLERTGVIEGYTTVLGARPDGSTAACIVLLAIQQRYQKTLVSNLKRLPEVRLCQAVNGEFDLMLTVEAPQIEDVDAVIDEVSAIDGVERCRSLMILSTKFDQRGATARPVATIDGPRS